MHIRRDYNASYRFPVTCLLLLVIVTCLYLSASQPALDGNMAETVQSSSNPTETLAIGPTIQPNSSNPRMSKVQHLMTMSFLIEEPEVCSDIRPNASLLIYVHSAPSNFKNRVQIRKSYGGPGLFRALGTVTVFMMGRSKDPEVDRAVRLESARYHDIIMADYDDTYHNLTFKAVSALTWVTRHCGKVPYVLKTDDDIFLNIFNVVRYVGSLVKYQMDTSSKAHIYCKILYSTQPMRNLNAKWYVSKEDYPKEQFPLYCSGSAYIMPGFVVPILHGAISKVPFLWLDDVYVTGLLRNMTGVIGLQRINSVTAITDNEYIANRALINGDGLFGHISGGRGLDLREKYWKELLVMESSELLNIET